jgi:tRNA-splicing ligase RtcB
LWHKFNRHASPDAKYRPGFEPKPCLKGQQDSFSRRPQALKPSAKRKSHIFSSKFEFESIIMGIHQIKSKHLVRLGLEKGTLPGLAMEILRKNFKHGDPDEALALLKQVIDRPEAFLEHEFFGVLAQKMVPEPAQAEPTAYTLRDAPTGYRKFGREGIDEATTQQMDTAMRLPVTLGGALMPDAHLGFGLPIGGVLATKNAVIPYAVGMDIGCRMALSILDIPASQLEHEQKHLGKVLKANTCFGKDIHDRPNDAEVLENPDFDLLPKIGRLKDMAARQLGSSGSGNHFVEFGWVELPQDDAGLGLKAGRYFGLLSHSGSRGLGATLASHFTELAKQFCKLPKGAINLAWLDLDTEEGQAYWLAMNLAGDYAKACHDDIHHRIVKSLGAKVLAKVENHHNFAWKETLPNGDTAIVHRKGATPAKAGEMGVIPGSMLQPGFVVRGKGHASALNSASHGAGRRLSRGMANASFTRSHMLRQLDKQGIALIGGNPDEAPDAYKDIHEVMAAQSDLVEIVAKFQPKIVRMDKE